MSTHSGTRTSMSSFPSGIQDFQEASGSTPRRPEPSHLRFAPSSPTLGRFDGPRIRPVPSHIRAVPSSPTLGHSDSLTIRPMPPPSIQTHGNEDRITDTSSHLTHVRKEDYLVDGAKPFLPLAPLPSNQPQTRGSQASGTRAAPDGLDMQPSRQMQVLKRSDNKRGKVKADPYADFDPHARVAEWLRDRDDNNKRAEQTAKSSKRNGHVGANQPIQHVSTTRPSTGARPAHRIPRKPVPTRANAGKEHEGSRFQDLRLRTGGEDTRSRTEEFVRLQSNYIGSRTSEAVTREYMRREGGAGDCRSAPEPVLFDAPVRPEEHVRRVGGAKSTEKVGG